MIFDFRKRFEECMKDMDPFNDRSTDTVMQALFHVLEEYAKTAKDMQNANRKD